MKITILLVDDHKIVLEGIRSVLAAVADFEVVGEAHNGRDAVEMATEWVPDVVVMDVAMALLNGLEACRQIRKLIPGSRILMLSAHNEDAYVEQARNYGAAGFVLKHDSGNTLVHAIREIHAGKSFFSGPIVKRYRSQVTVPSEVGTAKKLACLTPRETEVLQLVAEGKANKESASELGISIKTVEKHRNNLMRKLDIHDTASLTRYAIGAGVIESRIQPTIL
ncbi:MAG: response regulator transcription factor [Opitutales bacterium]|nr:response regulator transcription factor [Opitutales bacterium]